MVIKLRRGIVIPLLVTAVIFTAAIAYSGLWPLDREVNYDNAYSAMVKQDIDNAITPLKKRIAKLEAKVASLEKEVAALKQIDGPQNIPD